MIRLLVKVDLESLRLVKANENDYYFHLGGSDESRVVLHNAKMQIMSGAFAQLEWHRGLTFTSKK